ncbi:hypothetical protein BAUCODRAFT_149584 [Baudoinia panamericana UAMH 10762]|uniref:Uncharacterized protein n=1 Tax=Baudoinia panamericana (strain UAMH 10762) TaxID=717646 RepID=M2MSE6_BAUPA|nr:uncharacterized protein BAUCODRAFT_149584 [Baudoinia panamericana UAMH 10762]EMC94428.1 hypothetical protein BAUCODRAFT_149584 [Baudoinia panamericana UAMH 10762]
MSDKDIVRDASHAGSWYSASASQLDSQLEGHLAAVKPPLKCIGPQSEGQSVSELPISGARVIIGPHAGYSYSGPAAAWAYRCWDVSKAKRVFLLGPSHHHYTSRAALTRCTHYATPLGHLTIDRAMTTELYKSGKFEWMSQSVDEDEHSLEMHLPYIHKIFSKTFSGNAAKFPLLVPVMVGNTSASTEATLGKLLAPYLADETNAFVISSDFAHWGLRFRYTLYRSPGASQVNLAAGAKAPTNPAIHESIKAVDFDCIASCESGDHSQWLETLESTGNTVCGRHPIGVMMAAVEELRRTSGKKDAGAFKFVRYERSEEVKKVSQSSVSYASAFAVI